MSSLLAAALSLAACGGSGRSATSGTSASSRQSLTTVNVGVLPIIDVAPMYLGIQDGTFAKYGLKVVPKIFESGPAAIASLTSGEIQFGFSAPASEIQAVAQGIPIEAIVGAISQGSPLSQALIVKKDSSINSLRGLAGETIAVSALHAVNQIVVQALAEKQGMNPNDFHFIALPYPDMQTALASGQIGAAYQIEPFLTAGKGQGDQVAVANPQGQLIGPHTEFSNYITSTSYAQSHPTVVKAFVRAMTAADAYAQSHTAAVRDILPSYTGTTSATAQKIALGDFASQLDLPTFKDLATYMKQFGVIQSIPSMSKLVQGQPGA